MFPALLRRAGSFGILPALHEKDHNSVCDATSWWLELCAVLLPYLAMLKQAPAYFPLLFVAYTSLFIVPH